MTRNVEMSLEFHDYTGRPNFGCLRRPALTDAAMLQPAQEMAEMGARGRPKVVKVHAELDSGEHSRPPLAGGVTDCLKPRLKLEASAKHESLAIAAISRADTVGQAARASSSRSRWIYPATPTPSSNTR